MPVSGRKAELIERVQSSLTQEQLNTEFNGPLPYILTEEGEAELKRHEVLLSYSPLNSFSLYELNHILAKHPNFDSLEALCTDIYTHPEGYASEIREFMLNTLLFCRNCDLSVLNPKYKVDIYYMFYHASYLQKIGLTQEAQFTSIFSFVIRCITELVRASVAEQDEATGIISGSFDPARLAKALDGYYGHTIGKYKDLFAEVKLSDDELKTKIIELIHALPEPPFLCFKPQEVELIVLGMLFNDTQSLEQGCKQLSARVLEIKLEPEEAEQDPAPKVEPENKAVSDPKNEHEHKPEVDSVISPDAQRVGKGIMPWVVRALYVLFAPLGVPMLWATNYVSKKEKIIATIVMTLTGYQQ